MCVRTHGVQAESRALCLEEKQEEGMVVSDSLLC